MEEILSLDWLSFIGNVIIASAIVFHAFKAKNIEVNVLNTDDCCTCDDNCDCGPGDVRLEELIEDNAEESQALPDVPYDIWDIKSAKGRYTIEGLHSKIESLWSQAHRGELEPDYEALKSIARSLKYFIK